MRQALTRRLPYSPEDLFALVGDVERYPEFVPWVTALTTWNRKTGPRDVSTFDAQARVRFGIVHERFSTRVTLDRPALSVDVSLISGPFRRLENRWRFESDGEATLVRFEIDFEFRSAFLTRLLEVNTAHAINRLMTCFEERAAALYA